MLCHIYNYTNAQEAAKEWETEPYKGYGEVTHLPNGTVAHDNYECDDGGRGLVRCKKCKALLLVQYSTFEAMDSDHDGHYADWLPVWSEEEADLLNLLLSPSEFADYPKKHLRKNNSQYFWTNGEIPEPQTIESLRQAVEEKYGISIKHPNGITTQQKNISSMERYEELILRKSALQKECFQLEQEYMRVFGKDITNLFHLQLECARKKKTIEFCQMARNHGQEPDTKQLEDYIVKETAELQAHFQQLKEAYENFQSAGTVTEAELVEIRQTYHRLAKLIHPDLHPELENKLLESWNQIVLAYKCNDLESLKELEVVVAAALAEAKGEVISIEIPDLEEKIKKLESEIAEIMSKDPYQYKSLLSNPDAVAEKKKSLKSELNNYELYSKQLDSLLADVLPEGMIIVWDVG